MDYFIIDVVKDTDRIIIEFDSELSEIYVKNGLKSNLNDYDYMITSDNTFFEIPAKLNDKFTFAVTTKQLNGDLTSFYSFKVIFPDKGTYPFYQRIESSQNEFCIIDNSDSNKNRCLFLIPIYSYNEVRNTYFYANNEDYPQSNEITFFSKVTTLEEFEKENNKTSLFPTESSEDCLVNITNYINYTFKYMDDPINQYLLITIKSSNNGKIIFLPFYNVQVKSTNLRPNSKQLFNIACLGPYSHQQTNTLDINVKGNDNYNIELVAINGSAIVRFIQDRIVLYKNHSNYNNYSLYSSYTGIINPSTINYTLITLYTYNNDVNGLLFYIKYHWRSNKENFDEFEYGRMNYIKYYDSNIKMFPLSVYIKLRNDENDDSMISFTFWNNDTNVEKGDFNINSYVVESDYILNRKKDLTYQLDNHAIGEFSFKYETLSGDAYFSSDIIKSVKTNNKRYLLVQISSTNTQYSNITLKVERIINSVKLNDQITENIVPRIRGKYYISKLSSKINTFKFRKELDSHKSMKLELSLINDYTLYFSKYNENSETYYTLEDIKNLEQIKTECTSIYGKKICKIENLEELSSGVIVFIFISDNNQSQTLRLLNNNNNYISIKYKSFENSSVPQNEISTIDIPNSDININDNNEDFQILFEPIISDNVTYKLNIYNKNDFSNIEEINSIFAGEPFKSYSNFETLSNGTKKYSIKDIDKGEFYINVIADVSRDNDIESLVYTPKEISISKKNSGDDNDENDNDNDDDKDEEKDKDSDNDDEKDKDNDENDKDNDSDDEKDKDNDENDKDNDKDDNMIKIENNFNKEDKNKKNKGVIAVIIILIILVVLLIIIFIYRKSHDKKTAYINAVQNTNEVEKNKSFDNQCNSKVEEKEVPIELDEKYN